MKKLLAICLSVLLICAAMPFAFATAAEEPTIALPDLEVKAGDIIEVPILLKNNPGIVSAVVEVEYDKNVMELVTYYNEDEGDDFNQIVLGDGYNDRYVSWGPLGSCLVNFCHGTSKSKNYTDELFATATFKIKEDAAPGTYSLNVVHENKNFFNCVNDGAQQIDFAADHGSITVVADAPIVPDEPVYTEPTIVLPNLDVEAGDIIEVPILLKNNPGIVSAVVEVEYDKNVLELMTYYNEDEGDDFNQIVLGDGYNDRYVSWGPLGSCLVNFCHGTSKSKNYTDELFAIATFKVKEDAAPGTYALTVVHENKNFFNCVNDGAQQIDFAAAHGSITIAGDAPIVPPACEHEYMFPCDAHCAKCGELTNESAAHSVIAVEAKDATCTENGNTAYWTCEHCGSAWADEALTQITNRFNVIIPAAGHTAGEEADCSHAQICTVCGIELAPALDHNLIHMEGVEAGCHYVGQMEHWYCTVCETVWADEALTQITNHKNVVIPALGGDVEHVEALDPTCNSLGNIEYWHCAECDQYWADEALTQLTNRKNVIIGTLDHTIVHVDAVDATCGANGNIEYWYCSVCEIFWQNAELTQITNSKNVVIPALDHNLIHMEGVAPGCHYEGLAEHWYCTNCETVWADEALTQITNHKNVIIPALGGDVEHVAAKTPTCTENGNVEYWYCATCDQYWADEALTQLTNRLNVQVGASCKYNAVHTDGIEAGCHYDGWTENWYCATCDVYYLDADCTIITNYKDLTIPALKNTADYVAAKTPTCTENGNVEYWYCAECEQVWADEALTQLTNLKNVQIAPSCSYNAQHVDAVAPGCHFIGNTEYWYCATCDVFYADADCTIVTNYLNTIIPALGGDVEHVAAKAPTCTENGNVEYWYCVECEQVWADEALTQLTNRLNVVIGASCKYNAVHTDGIEAGCHYDGFAENWYCATCDVYYLDADCTIITNYKNLTIPALKNTADYVAAKTPTCTENGNVEYWFCAECEQVWADEALTQLTNLKNVQIAPSCSYNAQHFDAVAPGCHYIGNTEYWYCATCDVFYADAECTIITNYLSTIIPALGGDVEHVEAKEPVGHENGNIEYWFCAECEQVWADEALTQLTNLKNVIVANPNVEYVAAVEPTATTAGNVAYWYCSDCGKYFSDGALTVETTKEEVIIPATGTDEPVDPDKPVSPDTGDNGIAAVLALLTLIASGAAAVVLKNKKHA